MIILQLTIVLCFLVNPQDIAIQGLSINLADGAVYPASVDLHDRVVDAIATLWNCPREEQGTDFKHFAGSGTVGSTEACLLALLAHKFRVSNALMITEAFARLSTQFPLTFDAFLI